MEVGALYEVRVNSQLALEFYGAPAGEPALGPVAYMHRPSALDNPVAPIGHHWQDATHVAFGVLTTGVYGQHWKLEGSVFNGREPDDERWNFDPIRLDSYAGRLTVNPDSQWSMTAGYGFLKSPEALRPDESVHRFTASVLNSRKLKNGQWATSLVWGANDVSHEGWSNTALLESEAILATHNTIFGRTEYARKSAEELALPITAFPAAEKFDLGNLSLGYIRDFAQMFGATAGVGVMCTVNRVPESLEAFYGSRLPLGGLVFFRIRPAYKVAAPMGGMLTEQQAEEMIFGFVLLNDWSARDIQQWEYVPLGPFLAKAFATSISPWVVTREALEPFRLQGPEQSPAPLDYLKQGRRQNYNIELDVSLRAAGTNAAASISRTNFKYMYWSSVQQLMHHASSGCAMNVGDLLGSGTISGPEKNQRGSLLEISWNGTEPLELPGGARR